MFKAPRGTLDVLPADQPYWKYVIATFERLCARYGYQRIDTPTFEDAGLFLHGTGDSTDIVRREMYVFTDRGNDELALRPEQTPNIARAYLEHGLFNLPQPVKLYTIAPAFRYERPQAGRFREHHQLDLEALGEADPAIDAELIDFLFTLYTELGLRDLEVLLNSIGDQNCRPQYVTLLREFYAQHLGEVCADDRQRFVQNPLRMLDCKVPSCQPIVAAAPTIDAHLCAPCAEHFARVQRYLTALDITFTIAPRLVRGLDYYTRTVFEIAPVGAGSTGTIGAGGRYDGLLELLGGRPTPGIGFGSGIERIILNLKQAGIAPPPLAAPDLYIAIAREDDQALRATAVSLCGRLRHTGIGALVASGDRKLKAQLRHADRAGVRWAYILGGADGDAGVLREMGTGVEERLDATALFARLAAN